MAASIQLVELTERDFEAYCITQQHINTPAVAKVVSAIVRAADALEEPISTRSAA